MLLDELSQGNVAGKVICRVGAKLADILRGISNPGIDVER